MVEAMRRILLVEDDPRVRSAVRELLAEHHRYALVGEAATVADAPCKRLKMPNDSATKSTFDLRKA